MLLTGESPFVQSEARGPTIHIQRRRAVKWDFPKAKIREPAENSCAENSRIDYCKTISVIQDIHETML